MNNTNVKSEMIFYIFTIILFLSNIYFFQNISNIFDIDTNLTQIECHEDYTFITIGSMRKKLEVTSAFVDKRLVDNNYIVYLLINNYFYLTAKYNSSNKPDIASLFEPSKLQSIKNLWPDIYTITPKTVIKAMFFYKKCFYIMKGKYLWCYHPIEINILIYGPVLREKVFAFFNHVLLRKYNIHSIQFIPRADNYYDLFIVYIGTIFEIPLFFRGNTTYLINYNIFQQFNQEFRVIHYFKSLATINSTLGIQFFAGYYKFFRIIYEVQKSSVKYYFRFYFPHHLNVLYQCTPIVCLDNFDAIDYLNTTHFIIFIDGYYWFIPIIFQDQLNIHLSTKSARSATKALKIDKIDAITNNSTYFDGEIIKEKDKRTKFFFIFSNKVQSYYIFSYQFDLEKFTLIKSIEFKTSGIDKNVLAAFSLKNLLYLQFEDQFRTYTIVNFIMQIKDIHKGFISTVEVMNCEDIIISKNNELILFYGFKYMIIYQNNVVKENFTVADTNPNTSFINCHSFDYSMTFRSLRDFVAFLNHNEDIFLSIDNYPLEVFVKLEYEEKNKLKIAIVTLITIIILFATIITIQSFGYVSKGANWDNIIEDETNEKLEEQRHQYILGESEKTITAKTVS